MRAALTVLFAVVTAVGVASAQAADTVPRGTRVRVTPSTPSSVVVGDLIAVSDSALVIRTQGYRGDVTISRSAVMRLEVSRGTRRGTSAGWGALIGMGIGGLAGFAAGEDRCGGDAWFCIKRPLGAVLGGVTGVATGSLIGLLVGSVERWRDSAVPMSLSVVPTGEGSLSIGGQIAF